MNSGLSRKLWNSVMKSLESVGDAYEKVNLAASLGLSRRMRRVLLDTLSLKPGDKVLDAGCGPGTSAEMIARRVAPRGEIFLLDPLRDLLRAATRRLSEVAGVEVHPILGAFESIPMRNESVDVVVASYSLRDALDRVEALEEMARILKPGGRLGVVEVTRPDSGVMETLAGCYIRWIVPWIGRLAALRWDSPWRALYPTYRLMWRSSELANAVSRVVRLTAVKRAAFGVFTAVVGVKST
ncbi:MAG TPA: methyltransferase domain-containing protein [Candidatus Korarchaeota archaeon]|nr:methyltransferase domain-containing protein [Candidatus Korarchaeota archaeon]